MSERCKYIRKAYLMCQGDLGSKLTKEKYKLPLKREVIMGTSADFLGQIKKTGREVRSGVNKGAGRSYPGKFTDHGPLLPEMS